MQQLPHAPWAGQRQGASQVVRWGAPRGRACNLYGGNDTDLCRELGPMTCPSAPWGGAPLSGGRGEARGHLYGVRPGEEEKLTRPSHCSRVTAKSAGGV